ncbi:hypothetical protein Anas_09190 [Armadillidium nasatum]|uniref:Uncharacterized protein n=1 Tax=Armadillidium nasatum TaxID=96803 RepID=A0A5N5SRA3_9CRUS|nr:hypothetical protein Anas_09190 [Armadillidium nasatum]
MSSFPYVQVIFLLICGDGHITLKNLQEPGKEIEDGSFTRVVIVGDSFISSFIKMWPENSKVKPYFLYKDNITLNQILRFKIQNHAYLNNSEKIFVLFICGLHELSLYSTYKFHGCHGIHLPFKFIRKVENDSRTVNRYLKEMTNLKEKLENDNGVFVAFSYLPKIDIAYISHALSELSRSKNFDCSCNFSLGTSSSVESTNSISNINRNIFYRNLNETKLGIFEYTPVNVTFHFEGWCMYSKKLKLKENSDVLSLSYLLDQYVYEETDVKSNVKKGDVDSGVCSPVTLHTKISDTGRTLIIGDMWIKYVSENWDMKLDIKPYFYCKNGLTFNSIRKVITSVEKTGDRLLIISAIPSGEFLTISKLSECKDHSPLEYPVPNMLLLKDPLAYAEYSLYEKHIKNNSSHGNSKSLEDMHDCSDFETKLEHCFKKINKHAASLNKELGIPTCNVFSLMHKLAANNRPVFPTEAKAIPESLQKKLLQLFEKYVCSLYNENIFADNYKSKIDEKNTSKDTITDVILRNADIKVKIENKSADESTKSNSAEPSEKSRIVVFKEKKKTSTISEKKLAHSSDVKSKRKGPKKSFTKVEHKKDEPDNDDSHHPKSSSSDFRRHDSSSSYHRSNEQYLYYQNDYLVSSPDRYESRSKYSRDFPLRERKRSYTRSRSKDRKSSRSRSKDRYSRGINKDRRYIRSRSKDRTFYRNRSRDRRRSRSKSRNRNKRHSRSRSRSSSRKRSRSSRSPDRKHHKSKHNSTKSDRSYRSKSRSKSKNRSSGKLDLPRELSALEKNAVANLWEAHSREREMYRKHPENHPDHDRVKRMWLNIMNSQGLNTFDPSVLQCWWEYWLKKMEELIEASWEEKKHKCLTVLSSKRKTSKSPASSNSNSSSSDSEYERHSKKKKRSKSKKSKQKKKSRKSSPSRSKDKEKLLISDNVPTSVDEMERLLQEFVKKNSKSYEETTSKRYPVEKKVTKFSTSKGSEEMLDVFSILCQISDKFGALGMSLTVLHQKAVECVKNDLSPYNCIDEDAKMLLDLISDKIKKMLENSDMTFVQRAIVQEAHDRLLPFLESFEKSKEPSVNIESLAKATLGLQASEIIGFIKANLEYKGHKNLSRQNLSDIYLQRFTKKKLSILHSYLQKTI